MGGLAMSDLIRREDAVEMLREKAKGYTVSMFLTSGECHVAKVVATECAAEVKNLPAVDAEPEWISVADRLPKKDGKYIVCTAKGSVYCTKFSIRYNPIFHTDMNTHITHWMPLPEPPKMDGGNTDGKAAD
jgi:hypothetical protein